MIRLLIVDDHPHVLHGLQLLFGTVPGVEVVGVAANGGQAVTEADRLRPDVILMDVRMPGVDGVEATRQISAANPTARIVILTVHRDRTRLQNALRAGAAGFVLKYGEPEEVVRAVQAAHTGGRLLGPADASRFHDGQSRPSS